MGAVGERYVRGLLVVLLAVDGVAAIAGALFVVPTLPRDLIRWGPFTDFTVPAIVLAIIGALAMLAALGVFATPGLGAIAAVPAGLATAIYVIAEIAVTGIAIFERPGAQQGWTEPFFLTLGLAIAALGTELYRLHAAPAHPRSA